MDSAREQFDVAVIGGGLMGSLAAAMFQRRGLSCVVLESRAVGKEQKILVGEAITEGSSVFLRHEIGDEMTAWLKANAYRKFGFDFVTRPRNGSLPETLEDCHELLLSLTPLEKIPPALARLIPTYHVERTTMNAFARDLARARGADYRHGASVERVVFGAAGGTHTVDYSDGSGAPRSLDCRFVLDASGRRQVLARQLGITRSVPELDTASVWNRFEGVCDDPSVFRTFDGVDRRRHTIHMSGPGFWVWWIHQSKTLTSVGISYDRKQHAPDLKTEDRGFWEMARKFPPLVKLLDGARPLEPYQSYAHLAYQSERWIGDGWALIGDAGWFTDALYSVGIETACRQLMAIARMVEERARVGAACDEPTLARLNHEFEHLQRSVVKLNRFKYETAWARPHLVAQTAVYELAEIAELYNLQRAADWTEETRAVHYRLQWSSHRRERNLDRFLEASREDGDRDLLPGAPLLKKALLPGPIVYRATWPMWQHRKLVPIFFGLIRGWGYAERATERLRLFPDGLGLMAHGPLAHFSGRARVPQRRAVTTPAPTQRTVPDEARGKRYEAMEGFGRLERQLARIPCYRPATDDEVRRSFAAYRDVVAGGDGRRLIEVWRANAEPVRARLGAWNALYRLAGATATVGASWGMAAPGAHVFLATVRAALHAGRRLQAELPTRVAETLRRDFPWLERRHEHVPDGWTPDLRFPDAFRAWLTDGTLDDARARWALATALNEVQQAATTRHLAALLALPPLERHADREEALALHYLEQWAPTVSEGLWRQTIAILDGLNAAVFALVASPRGLPLLARAGAEAALHRREWVQFVDGLERPQWLWRSATATGAAASERG